MVDNEGADTGQFHLHMVLVFTMTTNREVPSRSRGRRRNDLISTATQLGKLKKFWTREPKQKVKHQDKTPEDKLGKYHMQVIRLLESKGGLDGRDHVKK